MVHSVHTPSFPEILTELNASVIVSTYQAGKLILLRNERGTLNTHFRIFQQFSIGWVIPRLKHSWVATHRNTISNATTTWRIPWTIA
jgi:hypothetical protein